MKRGSFAAAIFAAVLLLSTSSAFAATSDLNANGIPDDTEPNVVVSTNQTLPAGTYTFHNLTITNGATLTAQGDPTASGFKGVQITADNLSISSTSTISADSQGYGSDGPGSSATFSGSSYGGAGEGSAANTLYGSDAQPTDLGSGGGTSARGGGALRIIVSGTLQADGAISAGGSFGGDHLPAGSGGSIYITTNTLAGSGFIAANGGGSGAYPATAAGGGGRIAIYYQNSTFSGVTQAIGGTHFICFGCGDGHGQNGSIGFFNTVTHDARITSNWTFQQASSPFTFNTLTIDGAQVTTEPNTAITANTLALTNSANATFPTTLSVQHVTLQNHSTLTLTGADTLHAKDASLTGTSVITTIVGNKLSLAFENYTSESGSDIAVDGKGFGADGPGSPTFSGGASYGGAGEGREANTTYGSDTQPANLGSGGFGASNGGGAVRLDVSNTLTLNGGITAFGTGNGGGSGGSIYITTKNITGNGFIGANGGSVGSIPFTITSAGGGGRVALYYENNTYTGIIWAKGGSHFFCFGCADGFAGDGTVVVQQQNPQQVPVIIIPGILGSAQDNNGQWVIDPILHVYDDLIDTFKANGYLENKDIFPFPYDWHKSNVDTAILLKQKIDAVKAICQCNKVDIIAHSMGGLVARQYIQSDAYQNDVDKLVFLGTPHKGAPEDYLIWEGGELSPSRTVQNFVLNRILSQEAHEKGYADLFSYVQNGPVSSVRELLPTYDYIFDGAQLRHYPSNYPTNSFLEVLNDNVAKLTNSGVAISNFVGNTGDQSTVTALNVVNTTAYAPKWSNGYPVGFYDFFGAHGLSTLR